MKPLEGVTILDLTRLLPGAVATMWLANLGAEVIKIEAPGSGDYARSMPPLVEGQGAVFAETNRGKKSVVIDLKQEQGREALLALTKTADVLAEGFRPGVMDRLRLGYETLRQHNPRLIYLALTGFGQTGPYAKLAGHDVNYLALSGVLDLIGPSDGPPSIPGVQLADLAGSMQAVIGILAALLARDKSGRGQLVDVSMTGGVAALLTVPLAIYRATGQASRRGQETLSGRFACYNVYETSDGRWLSVGALEPKFWAALCRALDCEDLIGDQFSGEPRQSEVKRTLARILRNKTATEWFEILKDQDCCVAPVLTLAEAASAEIPAGRAPRLGEHTAEILARAGYDPGRIEALQRDKIIQTS